MTKIMVEDYVRIDEHGAMRVGDSWLHLSKELRRKRFNNNIRLSVWKRFTAR